MGHHVTGYHVFRVLHEKKQNMVSDFFVPTQRASPDKITQSTLHGYTMITL